MLLDPPLDSRIPGTSREHPREYNCLRIVIHPGEGACPCTLVTDTPSKSHEVKSFGKRLEHWDANWDRHKRQNTIRVEEFDRPLLETVARLTAQITAAGQHIHAIPGRYPESKR